MALNNIYQIPKPPEEGGGLFGSVLGGALPLVGGVIAAPFTGGASLLPALALSGVGATAGGMADRMMNPGKPGSQTGEIPHMEGAKPLDRMMKMPEVQLATMQNSKNLLKTSDMPNADEYLNLINQAQDKLKSRLGDGSSLI